MSDRGWICPRCETVHAPSVLKCECAPKKLDQADVQRLVDDAIKRQVTLPVMVPYVVPYAVPMPSPCCPEPYRWDGPRWQITSGDVYRQAGVSTVGGQIVSSDTVVVSE